MATKTPEKSPRPLLLDCLRNLQYAGASAEELLRQIKKYPRIKEKRNVLTSLAQVLIDETQAVEDRESAYEGLSGLIPLDKKYLKDLYHREYGSISPLDKKPEPPPSRWPENCFFVLIFMFAPLLVIGYTMRPEEFMAALITVAICGILIVYPKLTESTPKERYYNGYLALIEEIRRDAKNLEEILNKIYP